MTSPKTTEQLSAAIESLVASYINEVRSAASEAVERALRQSVVSGWPTNGRSKPPAPKRAATQRRSTEELGELGERLYELVRAQPGASMVTFADALGVSVRTLQRPMARLKAQERVRSVGQRNLMRYYPAAVGAAASPG
ncbi:MAG: hypothetical protein OEZ06_31010 [Myxococcales bacterium]|nr:hypothetical protein [Myxococcales bacterium]